MYKLVLSIILLANLYITCNNQIDSSLTFLGEKSTTVLTNPDTKNNLQNDNIYPNDNSQCSFTNCPPTRGSCVENKCICFEGYTTLPEPFQPRCNYKQKSRFIAFFLELFFPVGAGHLYAGRIVSALIKLFSFMMIVCSFCCNLCFIFLSLEQKFLICPSIIFILALVTWIILEGIDLVCFGMGIYKDGNGIELI
jgi:hypothetical protein